MSENPTKESILDLLTHLESQETRVGAILLALKDKGIVADDELAPYLAQAAKSSDVRMRAARARVEHLFSAHEEAKPATEATPQSNDTGSKGAPDNRAENSGEKKPSAENQPAAVPAPYAGQQASSQPQQPNEQKKKGEQVRIDDEATPTVGRADSDSVSKDAQESASDKAKPDSTRKNNNQTAA